MSFKKDDKVTFVIEDIGTGGEGIGKVDGYTLFVKDAIIGDKIEAKIIKAKKNYGYARAIGFKNSRGWEKTFAAEMIKNKKGSCYHFAALYAFLAKESGVEARICLGRTNGFNKARWQDHAWCEVKVGKKWYICDPNMDKFAANSKGKYFMKTVSSMKSTFKKSKTIRVNF